MKSRRGKEAGFAEEDMYEPVKNFFSSMGYEVRGEVKGCDIAMMKGDRLTVIELKKSLNITLVFQAMERRKITNQVYIALPRPKKARDSEMGKAVDLLKKLEIGLITVAMDSPVKTVEIRLFPPAAAEKKNKAREGVVKEIKARSTDGNKGGSSRKKLLTAFREKNVRLLCGLRRLYEAAPLEINKALELEFNCYGLLYRNYYGWFEKAGKGRYRVSPAGMDALEAPEYKELVAYYGSGEK